MTLLTFPTPPLPATAVRRSFLTLVLSRYAMAREAWQLLHILAPKQARKIPLVECELVARALLNNVSVLFPVYDIVLEELDGGIEEFMDMGVPIAPQGFMFDESMSSVLVYVAGCVPTQYDSYDSAHHPALKNIFPRNFRGPINPLPDAHKLLPKGRQWLEPWGGVVDALEYIWCETGNQFLDVSADMMEGFENPPWQIGDIEFLTGEWDDAMPVLKRINALTAYVDECPEQRLLVLDGILRGEGWALDQATRPARAKKGKTLAQIFTQRGQR